MRDKVHRIVLVVVVLPFRYVALCSMFLNQELVSFFVPIPCAMFLPISLHGISVYIVLVIFTPQRWY